MPARTKTRANFDFRGREFVWWIDNERWLRISSLDKKFIVALPLMTDGPALIEVIGSEFPGLNSNMKRPVWLKALGRKSATMGGWVNQVLCWSFDGGHEIDPHF